MVTLKELAIKEDLFTAGHCLCAGCGIPSILRVVLRATKYPLVVANASGCLQIDSTRYPYTSWRVNWIHSALENAAATMSGITATYRSLKKQGKLTSQQERKFLIIGGDGATYDIGFGGVSSTIERREHIVYLCYNNQLYASTGGHSSAATPMGAATPSTPAAGPLPGKLHFSKNISRIFAAHRIPYLAQSAPWIWQDLYKKAERAFDMSGPAYLNVLSPCPNIWKSPSCKSIELTKLAADTCVWPIFEIKNGEKVTVNYKPKQKLPVTEWLKSQSRFLHLLTPENKWIVDKVQEEVDKEWDLLLSSENDTKIRDN